MLFLELYCSFCVQLRYVNYYYIFIALKLMTTHKSRHQRTQSNIEEEDSTDSRSSFSLASEISSEVTMNLLEVSCKNNEFQIIVDEFKELSPENAHKHKKGSNTIWE